MILKFIPKYFIHANYIYFIHAKCNSAQNCYTCTGEVLFFPTQLPHGVIFKCFFSLSLHWNRPLLFIWGIFIKSQKYFRILKVCVFQSLLNFYHFIFFYHFFYHYHCHGVSENLKLFYAYTNTKLPMKFQNMWHLTPWMTLKYQDQGHETIAEH